MIKEIKYSGLSANPSDYDCPDGSLAAAMDLWPERGAWRPVLKPGNVLTLNSGEDVIYIHKTATNKTVYIISDSGGGLDYKESSTGQVDLCGTVTVKDISSVGNTLVVLTDAGLKYFLWKDTGYVSLGSHLPEIDMSFGLQGKIVKTDSYTITLAESITDPYADFSDNNSRVISDAVMGKVNKFIADEATNAGRFIYPFLVRFAYRLYDGSLTMHSAPVLMICSTEVTPDAYLTGINYVSTTNTITAMKFAVSGIVHQLDYQASKNVDSEWRDIIKSVEVFVSAPIYTYKQSGKVERLTRTTATSPAGVFKLTNAPTAWSAMGTYYQKHDIHSLYNAFYGVDIEGPFSALSNLTFELPGHGIDKMEESVRSCSQFYKLASLEPDNLSTSSRKVIDVGEEYLQSLVNREVMTDDFESHDSYIATSCKTYNGRLNLANIQKTVFTGFNAKSLVCFSNGYNYIGGTTVKTDQNNTYTLKFFFHTREQGKEIVTTSTQTSVGRNAFTLFPYVYAPNRGTYKITVNYGGAYSELTMKPHDFLNGAVYTGAYILLPGSSSQPSTTSDRTVFLPNRICTSEANNPFLFPVSYMMTVGMGEILGISVATRAISQGQFGQFPLYAFSNEGVFALEVGNTGTWTSCKPVSRDVCINRESITQIDSAVVFATDRGIMVISGGDCKCISDAIDNGSEIPFNLATFVNNTTVIPAAQAGRFNVEDFRTFLAQARTLYDYRSQRLIVFKPGKTYAYILAMDGSKMWSMMRSDITSAVNSYPDALAMTSGNVLKNFSTRGANGSNPLFQILASRPIKLDGPDLLKTVDCIITRGNFAKGHVQTVLYGSRDLANWFPVWSSKDHYLRGFSGTPYKYFRIVLKCTLLDTESISGSTVEYMLKENNQLR